jgi:catechol 2,3-dioxygenase-like lactoylglutathione lyase family enzyme
VTIVLRFGDIELFVPDPVTAATFYREVLGFEITTVLRNEIVWMKCGEVELLLRPGKPTTGVSEDYRHAAAGYVLYTDDLDKTSAALRARGLQFQDTDGSPRCLTFADPAGNWFQLVNPAEQ